MTKYFLVEETPQGLKVHGMYAILKVAKMAGTKISRNWRVKAGTLFVYEIAPDEGQISLADKTPTFMRDKFKWRAFNGSK